MCGLVGIAGPAAADRRDLVTGLLADLAERGPDARGVVAARDALLAATRLRVQGDERGDPPVRSADGAIVLAFNGEVLARGRQALRRLVEAAGGRPPDAEAGDAPLLAEALAALARGGDGLEAGAIASLLDGTMGALAVLDTARGTTWLARDRLGIKPLAAVALDDGLLYASTLRPLLRAVPATRAVEPAGLAELLHRQHPVGTLPFRGVEAVRPGAVWRLRVHPRTGRFQRTVFPGEGGLRGLAEGERLSGEAGVAALAEALGAAASDAAGSSPRPPVVFLSGGLDAACALAFSGRDDLEALTGRFAPPGGPFDESAAAAATAEAAGVAHRVVDLEDGDLLEDLPDVVDALEIPLAGPGSLALWRLARLAREGGPVVLTGTGGDELLGGYARTALALGRRGPWTRGYEPLDERMATAGDDPRARLAVALDRAGDLRGLLSRDLLDTLPPVVAAPVADTTGEGDAVDALLAVEVEQTLPALLHVEDRILGAHGLEGRPVPCLGEVPRIAARLDGSWRVGPDGEGKRALRAAAAGRVPDAVRRDPVKRGFPTPFHRAATGAGRARAEAILGDRAFVERGWWDVARCRALLDAPRPAYDRALFAMLAWESWARSFLDGDSLAPESR